MANKVQPLALPDHVFSLLAQADKDRNFPPGTMQSLLMQETSGKPQYIQDPTTYHYPADLTGKRKSTAQGPFGILASTGKDPGYGVKPLGDPTNFAEHVRFAADYLDARSKSAGSLNAGLAGYGEGAKYAAQVARRRDGIASMEAPVVMAQAAASEGVAAPVQATLVAPVVAQAAPVANQMPTPDQWQTYLADKAERERLANVQPAGIAFGDKAYVPPEVQQPNFMAALSMLGQNNAPNFYPFGSFGRRKA